MGRRRVQSEIPEARKATRDDVIALYRDLLGRAPESEASIAAMVGRSLLEVAVALARSEEFRTIARATTDKDVVTLYRDVLGREPESKAVVSGNLGRPLLEVATEFARSEEFRALKRGATENDVVALYRDLLHREPESAAVVSARLGRPVLDVALEFARSEEFLRRHLFQASGIRELYRSFFPSSRLPDEWFEWFSRIVNAHGTSLGELLAYFLEMALDARGVSGGYPEVARSLIGSRAPLKNFDSRITVVIPTINSMHWLGHLIDHYRGLDVSVVFAVDARTSDETRKVLAKKKSAYFEVRGEHPRVESLMQNIVSKLKSQWILRLDDDEVPSPALLKFVDKAIEGSTEFTWGFPRVYLRYERALDEVQYSRFLPIGPIGGADRQWRLFSKSGVKLADALHTPGFIANCKREAPGDAVMFHFDWVLRSLGERITKVRSYEAQDRTPARALAHLCLYEMVPESWHMFTKLDHRPYVDLASKIFHANARDLARSDV